MNIGILAYGSLIEDPGIEIEPLIDSRISDVETPFKIEFSRSSSSRDGAPTLVPVERGGASVRGEILVFNENVTLEKLKNLLWRRERRKEKSKLDKQYKELKNPSLNSVIVEVLKDFCGLEYVLFTKIGANIQSPTADELATLAIESAKKDAGMYGKDGISYLISVKNQGIKTPLMKEYEESILQKLNVETLEEAHKSVMKII